MSDYVLGVLMGTALGTPLGMAGLYCWYYWTEIRRRRNHLPKTWKAAGR